MPTELRTSTILMGFSPESRSPTLAELRAEFERITDGGSSRKLLSMTRPPTRGVESNLPSAGLRDSPSDKRTSESDFDSGGNHDYVPSGLNVRLALPLEGKHLVGVTNANNVGG